MDFRTFPAAGRSGTPGTGPSRRSAPDEPALVECVPDEPLAVITVGPSAEDRRAVLAGLLNAAAPPLRVPAGSFLVVDYAPSVGGAAYVPGLRSSREYRPEPVGAGPALARPPRRVELTVPDPLLRHFTLVDAPDTGTLGVAGARVVRDAVRRGGALLYVLPDDQPVTATELELLAEVADEAAVFLVGTPGAGAPGVVVTVDTSGTDGGWPARHGPVTSPGSASEPVGPPTGWVETQRAALATAVPALAGVDWIDLDPAAADTAYLRRALIDWASTEGLRRASLTPPVAPGATRTVPVVPTAADSDWADRLDRRSRSLVGQLRRDISLAVAAIHLRCVQEVVGGTGVPGLPGLLDREVEALSLDVVAACDTGVDRMLAESLALVFGETPDEGVRLRAAAAVGWGLAADRADRDFDRVLLIRETGEVETVYGLGAVGVLAAYPAGTGGAILPPLGVGLSGGCYQYWRNPARADPDRARSWLRQVLRETEVELCREVSRRFEAIAGSLANVLAEAVRHGRLLA
ncbi:P-loop NTPase family protein [Plantactinospora endophytica]|uniref:Uncharacterized protein n=1 Tax=Plantactinospora endophytica TaxID=673535 RepID=A0ABQ4DVR0_9ACTN|nr:hypothetical protein [Plantactinospora endophytica]GIG86192.1 hypothetical protein Pen02_11280 [Plantactinospora endophytica]